MNILSQYWDECWTRSSDLFNVKNRRKTLFLVVLWLLILSIYLVNRRTSLASYDSTPNSLIVLNLLEHHTLHLDRFLDAEAYRGLNYFFIEGQNKHGSSRYPIGPAIITAPIYFFFYLFLKMVYWGREIPLGTLAFEPTRFILEKAAAAILAATSAVIFFGVARQRFNQRIALIVTFIFAFATNTWTVSSQGLWQHGPMNLLIVSLTFAFLQAQRRQSPRSTIFWLIMAGFACGLLPGMRPTSLLFVVVALLWSGFYFRGKTIFLIMAAIVAALPAALWNFYYFNDPIMGGYKTLQYVYDTSVFPVALAGLTVSPSRGILVYTPVVLFAFLGCWSLFRHTKRQPIEPIDVWILGLFIAGFGIIANSACIKTWYAGSSYGPRFLTDVMPATCLMMAYWLQDLSRQPSRQLLGQITIIGFIVTAAFSTFVQFLGAAVGYEGYGPWHYLPTSMDSGNPIIQASAHKRIWSWDDPQISRSIQSLRYRRQHRRTMQPPYFQALSGEILEIHDQVQGQVNDQQRLQTTPNAIVDGRVMLKNRGPEAWYGYKSGIFTGEVIVQGLIHDANQNLILSTEFPLADQTVLPGQSGEASGMMIAPALPGTYQLTLRVGIRGVGWTNPDQIQTVVVPLIVVPANAKLTESN